MCVCLSVYVVWLAGRVVLTESWGGGSGAKMAISAPFAHYSFACVCCVQHCTAAVGATLWPAALERRLR